MGLAECAGQITSGTEGFPRRVCCATGLVGAEFVQAGSPAFRDIAITNREADREGVKVARCRPEQGAAMVSAELNLREWHAFINGKLTFCITPGVQPMRLLLPFARRTRSGFRTPLRVRSTPLRRTGQRLDPLHGRCPDDFRMVSLYPLSPPDVHRMAHCGRGVKRLWRPRVQQDHAANVQPRQRSALPLAAISASGSVVESKTYRALPLAAGRGSAFKSRQPDQTLSIRCGRFSDSRKTSVDKFVDLEVDSAGAVVSTARSRGTSRA